MKKAVFLSLIPALLLTLSPVWAVELGSGLAGRILLQVEANGEAWYINPQDNNRYFLGRPLDAWNLMRDLGLGISQADFDSYNGFAPKRLAGRILLQVEANGEAWYVDPQDKKMHYLGRPADAFRVMRESGLGISDADLDTIPAASGYGLPAGSEPGEADGGEQGNGDETPVCADSACASSTRQYYEIEANECVLKTDDCSDCSCSCGGYDREENTDNDNCTDSLDNDCDGLADENDIGCFSGTIISENISANAVWGQAGGPYLVQADIIVESGSTLTVEAGTIVKFASGPGETEFSGYIIRIDGALNAAGSESDPIVFTSAQSDPQPGDWGAIELVNGGTANLEYVQLEYADTAISAPNAANLSLTNSSISRSNTALYLSGSATVQRNVFEENGQGIVFTAQTDSPRDDGSYKNFGRLTDISYNTIRNNSREAGELEYIGLDYYRVNAGNRLDLRYNLIEGNNIGVKFTDSDNFTQFTAEKNNIMNNLDYNAYVDTSGGNIVMEDNWWGTDNTGVIDDKIYDFFDVSFSYPQVDYQPISPAENQDAGA